MARLIASGIWGLLRYYGADIDVFSACRRPPPLELESAAVP
jgi:hypothetical protein